MAPAKTSKREYGRMYPVAKAIMRPAFSALWRINVTGLHNVPGNGPAIFCPNHISFFDSLVLPVVLPRRISYVGKAEYMDSWKTKYIFPALGMIPIDRGGGDKSQAALDTAARVLDRGEFFGIYPEGTRSRNGVLHRGHTGPARLALRTGAPIIPVGLRGTDKIQPPDKAAPRPFVSCQVNIGKPIEVGRYSARKNDRLLLRELIDEVMYEIRGLSGQDYVDEYAGKPASPQQTPEFTSETVNITSSATETADLPTTSRAGSRESIRIPSLRTEFSGVSAPVDGERRRTGVIEAPAFDLSGGELELVMAGAPGAEESDNGQDRKSSADALAKWWS